MRTAATLDADHGAPRAARDLVRGMAKQVGCDPRQAEVAALLTSELVTNAVLHAGAEVVEVRYDVDLVQIEVAVHDPSSVVPVARNVRSEELHGRGLSLVDALAEAWGVNPQRERGKAIWFRLPCHLAGEPTTR